VPRSELARGYEFEKDRYVLLDDEDFANAAHRVIVHDDGEQVRRA
jgi:non-homologous end joining protein Ku